MTRIKKPLQLIKTPIQLLFYGDFGCTTGFGNVSMELINQWKKDKNVSITVFSINDFAENPYYYDDNVFVIPAMQASRQKKDVYCRAEFLNLIYQSNFDVVFFLNDIEVFNQMHHNLKEVVAERKKKNRPKFRSILYFPVDSPPMKKDLEIISFFDEVVTYTDYGMQVVRELLPKTLQGKIKVIPHGVNTMDFHPLEKEAKDKIKERIYGTSDVFVFGTVNRNSARKDLATLIIGFSKYKSAVDQSSLQDVDEELKESGTIEHKPKRPVLYLHCNPKDPAGIDIFRLCERLSLKIGEDVFIPSDFSENRGYSISDLNEIYNSFDCFMTTTTSEGWGLTVTEAMATKTLVVCPLHTSLVEITDQGANTINFLINQEVVFVHDFEKVRYMTTSGEVAKVMHVVCNEIPLTEEACNVINKKIEDAYSKVSSMKWGMIATRFMLIIKRLAK